MRKRLPVLMTLVLAVLVMLSGTALAAITAPDSGPYITRVDVYRHALESDDMLVVVRYNIPYLSVPADPVSQTFVGRYRSGATELARVLPYAYYNRGYDRGMFSMYLDATSAPAWEGAYTVELQGSPTLEWLSATAGTAMTGAVADDGGAQTDETTAANNSTADDMTLLPATPEENDAYYFGGNLVFSVLTLNIGQQGEGVWTVTWEYSDPDGWATVSGLSDATNGFEATVGNHDVTFDPPTNWTQIAVSGITAYWLRARVSAYTSVTTQPLGTQCWVNSGEAAPSAVSSGFNWRAATSQAATQALLYAHLIEWAEELGDYWNVSLTTTTPLGKVLSSYGETYFASAIVGLRTMCPGLFQATETTLQYEDVEYTKGQSEATKGTWPFDWGGMSQYFGLPSNDEVFRTLIGFAIVFFICALIMSRTNRPDFAIMAGYALLVVLAVPGWISPVIVAGFSFISILGAAMVFILGKAT